MPQQKFPEIVHRILDAADDTVNYRVERMQFALEQKSVRSSYVTVKRGMKNGTLQVEFYRRRL